MVTQQLPMPITYTCLVVHDGTNYLNDAQFTQINTNGSVDAWTFANSLPEPIRQADGFAVNGYLYLMGGRTDDTTCASNTWVTPISANTTIATGNNPTGIGGWYETTESYTGDRYGGATAYYDGNAFVVGGGCGATTIYTGANRVVQTGVQSQPQDARYSYYIDADSNIFPNNWLANGLDNDIGARWSMDYRSSADASNVIFHESFDDGTNGVSMQGTNDPSTNSDYYDCYNNDGSGTATHTFDDSWNVTEGLSKNYDIAGGTGSTVCDVNIDQITTTATRYDRFYVDFGSNPASNTVIYAVEDAAGGDTVAQLRINTSGNLQLRDRFTTEDTVTMGTGTHRIEVGILNDQMTVRVYSEANLHTSTVSDSDIINLGLGPNVYDEVNFGIITSVNTWSLSFDEHKASQSDWLGSAFPVWGQSTNFGPITLGSVETYTPLDESETDTDFARWYYLQLDIDSSQAYGYPDDVTRGPTLDDLTLFFTADPNKALRHGKTFIQGLQQPLHTPPP